ncbi:MULTISPECIES: hypothetical protein [unclassified Methylobacterium]|uniref:hypothetical protein n=1 Tax=unclassified Methylobacterium TaxID=2615210 RepID=UPI0006F587EB|nr:MULTISPECIES: hypothetical protein [unclassified Methylobacterium]KQO44841.1 hypothetical protein ASF08_07395 [Methylobacterium sp. Leaf85]TXN27520.1 hypothetical protein FV220_10935 [Methylobacterium sp. WL19]
MDASLIAMNDEANRIGSERLLTQLREEGLVYRLWVTGTAKGSRLHMQVNGLDDELEDRLVRVLRGRGMQLDIQPLTS